MSSPAPTPADPRLPGGDGSVPSRSGPDGPAPDGPAPDGPGAIAGALRRRDAAALAERPDTIRAHTYEGDWYNNATFVFPFLAAVGALIAWAIVGGTELLGIGLFFLVVTAVMLPLVWLTWQRTPTVVLVRKAGLEALHQGTPRQYLAWDEVSAVRRVETMGNVRWYIVGANEDHMTLEGEIADLETLLAEARHHGGLPPE